MIEFTLTMAGRDIKTKQLYVTEHRDFANDLAKKYFRRMKCDEIYLDE